MTVNRKYIYGFTKSDATLSSAINGIDGKPICNIDNGVAAVVSDVPDGNCPERKHLSAHHSVIKEIMKTSTTFSRYLWRCGRQ